MDIRVSNVGEGSKGLYNVVDERDFAPFNRIADIETVMNEVDGRRTFLDQLSDTCTKQKTLFQDVRDYVLHEWQERVFRYRDGPWKDPKTSFVRPQVVGEARIAHALMEPDSDDSEDEYESFEYASDADFEINKPGYEDIVRQYALRMAREGQPLNVQARETLAQLICKDGPNRWTYSS